MKFSEMNRVNQSSFYKDSAPSCQICFKVFQFMTYFSGYTKPNVRDILLQLYISNLQTKVGRHSNYCHSVKFSINSVKGMYVIVTLTWMKLVVLLMNQKKAGFYLAFAFVSGNEWLKFSPSPTWYIGILVLRFEL